MAIAPSGLLSTPIHLARLTVAASASFQAWVGAASKAWAFPYVIPDSVESDELPIAVIGFDETFSRTMVAGGARHFFQSQGALELELVEAVTEDDDVDAFYAFTNTVGAIVAEMEALAGTPGYLAITNISFKMPPGRANEDEAATRGDVYVAILSLEYGP